MSSKPYFFLIICLLGLQFNCQTKQASENIPNNTNRQIAETNVSDEEIKLLFIDSGLVEGDGNLEKLMALPKEKVISVVQKIKSNGISRGEKGFQSDYQSESLKIKSAFFLWKLGVDSLANEKYVVDAAQNKDINLRFDAVGFLEVIIGEGSKEYLPIIFNSALEVDGGPAEEMLGFFVDELENSPEIFLLYLSKEPFKIRKSVYQLVFYSIEMIGEETFEKIKSNVQNLTKNRETKNIAEEFLREVNKKQ